jgi:hypothetical protein
MGLTSALAVAGFAASSANAVTVVDSRLQEVQICSQRSINLRTYLTVACLDPEFA